MKKYLLILPLLFVVTRPSMQPGTIYVTPRGSIYYRDPIQTPRYKKGVDFKFNTQIITLPNGGSMILNRYYSK